MKVCAEEDCPLYDQYLSREAVKKYSKHQMPSMEETERIKMNISSNCHICKYNVMERMDVKAYLIKEMAKDILLRSEDEN